MSSTRFSTTTTATGLPFMEENPAERKPSLALREVRTRISLAEREKRMSVHKMSFRQRVGSIPNVASAHQVSSSHLFLSLDFHCKECSIVVCLSCMKLIVLCLKMYNNSCNIVLTVTTYVYAMAFCG